MAYTLDDVRKEYRRLDALLGVNTENIRLTVSKRCVRRYGVCKFQANLPSEIVISDFILDEEELFWATIRHEYTHALVKLRAPNEHHGHDKVFYDACREVGVPASRCLPLKSKPQPKYTLTCLECGKTWTYYRRSKTIAAFETDPHCAECPVCKKANFLVKQFNT